MAPGGQEQVALLHRVSAIVSSNLSLDKMLQNLVKLAVDATHCDACLVYLLDQGSDEVVLRASQLPHSAEIGSVRLKMGEGVTGWVGQHKSVVALGSNAAADARFKPFQVLPEDSYEAFLSVPLISNGELIGVINIHHLDQHAHSPDEIALVSFIGEQMGGAIAKSQLEKRSENASRQMEALAGLARTISEQNYLDRILQAISEMVAKTLDSPVCSLMLVDEDRRELTISATQCSSADYLYKGPITIADSVIGRVVREGRPIVISNMAEEKQYRYPELARQHDLASLLSVPMIFNENVIGTINIYAREIRHFSEDDIGFLKVAAGQAAIIVKHARLLSETLEMKRMLEGRKLIERAKGILQQKYSLTEEDAYLRLRDESRHLHRPMRDLAEAVILAAGLEKTNPEKP